MLKMRRITNIFHILGTLIVVTLITGSEGQQQYQQYQPGQVQQWQLPKTLKDNPIIKFIGGILTAVTKILSKWKPAGYLLTALALLPYLVVKAILREKEQKLQMKGTWSQDKSLIAPKIRKFRIALMENFLDVFEVLRRFVINALPSNMQALMGTVRFFGGGAISYQAVKIWNKIKAVVFAPFLPKKKNPFSFTPPTFKPPARPSYQQRPSYQFPPPAPQINNYAPFSFPNNVKSQPFG